MNAVQAIRYAQSKVSDPTISKEEDALMLCWLLHAYSDIHQPLHTTAMFSKTLLPKGYRGGNSIKTKQGRNLHSQWDGLLGKDNKYQACHNQAARMLEDADLASLCDQGASVTDAKSVCRGSSWYCKNYAYVSEVRAHLQRLEDDGETKLVAVDLSELYLKRAGAVAGHQASRAGWRLAKVLGG
ncbi:MAG: S1/P1 nuclease [Pirellulales bacterium]